MKEGALKQEMKLVVGKKKKKIEWGEKKNKKCKNNKTFFSPFLSEEHSFFSKSIFLVCYNHTSFFLTSAHSACTITACR